MTIILFLIDTSASMNQRTYLGARPTLLDVAKDAVEKFIKIRQRDSASRGDRYMLLTFEEPPGNIKAGWKESLATFMSELKNLQCVGMTTLGGALKSSFDLLNINRMQTGIDTYGQGRSPFYLEPSIIIVITDGGRLTTTLGVQEELNLPMHSSVPGSELTKEPFRWDQRLFSLVLRLTGIPPAEREPSSVVPSDTSPVDAMCEVTGGRSYAVISQRMLMQCLESLVQKLQGGVVINFEKIGPDPPLISGEDNGVDDIRLNLKQPSSPSLHPGTPSINGTSSPPLYPPNNNTWQSCRKLIYVQRSAQKGYTVGHWPIPESFWPDPGSPALPPRTAHPIVKFSCTNSEPMVIDNLPFDKYELEPSPLTQYILSRKQPTVAWQVFVSNSFKNSEVDHPFGYLKASTSLTCVNLFVMPYNYPILLPLLDDLFKIHRCKAPREWKNQFDNYLKNMPLYYAAPLKRALQRMGAPNLVPDTMENCLNYSVLNYLKRLKNQAKTEFEKLISMVGTKKTISEGIRVNPAPQRPFGSATKLTEMNLTPHLVMNDRFTALKNDLNDFNLFVLYVKDREIKHESYRNAYDIPRNNILDQLARMRSNFLQCSLHHTRLQDEDQMHSLPISQMGNYQDYLKRFPPPLREIESIPVRQHMFGNPFKIDKRMMVDEADIDLVGSGGSSPMRGQKRMLDSPVGSPRAKRKPGPLPKDFPVWRPQSPVPLLLSPVPTLPVELPSLVPLSPASSDSEDELYGIEKERSAPPLSPIEDGLFSWNSSDMPAMNHVNHRNSGNHVDLWEEEPEMPHIAPSGDMGHFFQDTNFRTEIVRVRSALFKEVRKPGRNFGQLFKQLEAVDSNIDVQIFMVKEVINEAFRFKRKYLIKLLEDFQQSLLQTHRITHIEPPTYSRFDDSPIIDVMCSYPIFDIDLIADNVIDPDVIFFPEPTEPEVPLSHASKVEQKQQCPLCQRILAGKSSLYRHMRNRHPVYCARFKKVDKTLAYPCDKCEKSFNRKESFVRHKRKKHDGSPPRTVTAPRRFMCNTCQKTFTTIYNLRKHTTRAHQEEVEIYKNGKKCSECDSKFTSRTSFLEHLPIIHGISVHCDILLIDRKEDFEQWKEDIEKETVSCYIKDSFIKSDADNIKYISYKCHRSGTFKSKSTGQRKLKDTCKINYYCPASISLKPMTKAGLFPAEVKYISTHVGHECEVAKLGKEQRMKYQAGTKDIVSGFVNKLRGFSDGEQCKEIDKAIKMLTAMKKKKEKKFKGEKSTAMKKKEKSEPRKIVPQPPKE